MTPDELQHMGRGIDVTDGLIIAGDQILDAADICRISVDSQDKHDVWVFPRSMQHYSINQLVVTKTSPTESRESQIRRVLVAMQHARELASGASVHRERDV